MKAVFEAVEPAQLVVWLLTLAIFAGALWSLLEARARHFQAQKALDEAQERAKALLRDANAHASMRQVEIDFELATRETELDEVLQNLEASRQDVEQARAELAALKAESESLRADIDRLKRLRDVISGL